MAFWICGALLLLLQRQMELRLVLVQVLVGLVALLLRGVVPAGPQAAAMAVDVPSLVYGAPGCLLIM